MHAYLVKVDWKRKSKCIELRVGKTEDLCEDDQLGPCGASLCLLCQSPCLLCIGILKIQAPQKSRPWKGSPNYPRCLFLLCYGAEFLPCLRSTQM
eukprot:scaffold870_cov393-Prasinococcus_capsulatus_cf.AAC.40